MAVLIEVRRNPPGQGVGTGSLMTKPPSPITTLPAPPKVSATRVPVPFAPVNATT